MKIIAEPKKEQEILLSVKEGAGIEEIQESIIKRADACVVHLCGCLCDPRRTHNC